MIIQILLIFGLVLCLVYAQLQRGHSRLIAAVVSGAALAGIYFVLAPERTNQVARFVGVGRGADLLLYCWVVIGLAISVNLQFKLLKMQSMITALARELALRDVRVPEQARER
jgi:hypothetical protein